MILPEPIQNLITAFERLPGIGPKSASRLAFYLLRAPEETAQSLAEALIAFKEQTAFCPECFNIMLAGRERCEVCASAARDESVICVVEEPLDVIALERIGAYNGKYHVLHGVLSPIEGIGPDDLKIELQEDATLKTVAASHHLHYFLEEPIVLRDWYVKTFSFTSGIRGNHQSANVPGMNLSFQPNKPQPPLGTKGRTLDHIGFEIKNLEAFCKKLEASGIKFDVAYRKVPALGISIAFFTDPFGTYIELTEGLSKL